MEKLSQNFDWDEANTTDHRNVNNNIPIELYPNIRNTSLWMERVRNVLGDNAIHVLSWYRSPHLNLVVGGSKTSEHMTGQAVDFKCPKFGRPVDIVKTLSNKDSKVYFNQLILEHTWVHISFSVPPVIPKMQVLTLLENKKYALGITDKYGNLV